jgi:uncharacterized protein (DUF2147 family)
MMRSLAAAFVLVAGAAGADPIEGLWRTMPDDNGTTGLMEVAACGDALCGTLVRAYDAAGREVAMPNLGRQLLWDAVPHGNGRYRGRIHAPDRDQDYAARLRLRGDRLSISVCVLGICRLGGVWTRVD